MSIAPVFKSRISPEKADLVLVPIPWALKADNKYQESPDRILETSNIIELFHEFYGYQRGCSIGADLGSSRVDDWQSSLEKALDVNETTEKLTPALKSVVALIQEDYKKVSSFIEEKMEYWLGKEKLPVILGGDGSVGLGALRGTAQLRSSFGVLQLGSKPCLKETANHLNCSEDSVLFNAGVSIPEISKIVSVGLSEIAQEEYSTYKNSNEKIIWFTNRKISNYLIKGDTFAKIAGRILNNLPEFIHLSFHASVLKNLKREEIEYLLQIIVESRRKIVGVDISGFGCESKEESKEAAEIVFMICKAFGRSRGKK